VTQGRENDVDLKGEYVKKAAQYETGKMID
jgi:hypothetical protein